MVEILLSAGPAGTYCISRPQGCQIARERSLGSSLLVQPFLQRLQLVPVRTLGERVRAVLRRAALRRALAVRARPPIADRLQRLAVLLQHLEDGVQPGLRLVVLDLAGRVQPLE